MKSSDVLLKTAVNPKILLQLSHGIFLKSNVAFLLLQTFEIFDKIAKIKTIKTIFMNSSVFYNRLDKMTKVKTF